MVFSLKHPILRKRNFYKASEASFNVQKLTKYSDLTSIDLVYKYYAFPWKAFTEIISRAHKSDVVFNRQTVRPISSVASSYVTREDKVGSSNNNNKKTTRTYFDQLKIEPRKLRRVVFRYPVIGKVAKKVLQ